VAVPTAKAVLLARADAKAAAVDAAGSRRARSAAAPAAEEPVTVDAEVVGARGCDAT